MALFQETPDGYEINETCIEESYILQRFYTSAKEHGFDKRVITYGVRPSPDFGYWDLASRYWRASLCLYFSGCVGCFWESGEGFTEPWLFNARHSFELSLKGCLLFSVWLEQANENLGVSGYVERVDKLRSHFPQSHSLQRIYDDYARRVASTLENWNSENCEEPPSLQELVLNPTAHTVLQELDAGDPHSFTFRYPSRRSGTQDVMQRCDWRHDATQLYPATGLPKKSGYWFDPIKTANSLHDFNLQLSNIKAYLGGIGDHIGHMYDYL